MPQSIELSDRERALLVVADQGRTMQAETQDLLALIDFIEGGADHDFRMGPG